METSPKVASIQSKKRGPRTERGKQVVSQNALRHGIFAQKPPLLAGEDLEGFESTTQALIQEFEPQSPSEFILIQQAAMALLRLYRLWTAETALTQEVMLRFEKAKKFPEDLQTAGAALARWSMAKAEKSELEALEDSIKAAEIAAASKTIDVDRLYRQERLLNRQLHEALDRLKLIESERQ